MSPSLFLSWVPGSGMGLYSLASVLDAALRLQAFPLLLLHDVDHGHLRDRELGFKGIKINQNNNNARNPSRMTKTRPCLVHRVITRPAS